MLQRDLLIGVENSSRKSKHELHALTIEPELGLFNDVFHFV
jgi:hypothetical protein